MPARGDRAVNSVMNYIGAMDAVPYVDVEARENSVIEVDPRRVTFEDARPLVSTLSLDREGFRLIQHKTRMTREEFADPALVERVYLAEMAEVVREATGADRTISALGPVVRLNRPDPGAVQPAPLAHSDYTDYTLRTQLGYQVDLSDPQFAQYSKILAYQTWRAISPPPQDNTLAFCDARSVSADDRVLSRFKALVPKPGILEFYMYKYNPAHRWYYFSNLEYDELLIFKGFEGDEPDRQNVLHGGFENTACPPGASPRQSIETRVFAFFR